MPVQLSTSKFPTDDPEISRLLTAAVINQNFRKMLLRDPASAIRSGFNGEKFHLSGSVIKQLQSIRAVSLADFASQLVAGPRQAVRHPAAPLRPSAGLAISPGLD